MVKNLCFIFVATLLFYLVLPQFVSSATLTFTQTLQKGSRGNDVLELQKSLAKDPSIYPEGFITGYFGAFTEVAVRRFQAAHSLPQVGIVGPKTRAKLNEIIISGLMIEPLSLSSDTSSIEISLPVLPPQSVLSENLSSSTAAPIVEIESESASVSQKFTTPLKRGSSGKEVEELQEFLKQFTDLYPEGIVSGYFGPLTELAVLRCQQRFGLDPSGTVGPKTRAKLNELWLLASAEIAPAVSPVVEIVPRKSEEQSTSLPETVMLPLGTMIPPVATLERAQVLEIPLPKNLDCFDDRNNEASKRAECFPFYNYNAPSRLFYDLGLACPRYFNPVHDEQGIMYPTACWAEQLGATTYQHGLGTRFKQFMNDLWYTPKKNFKSYQVPSPPVELSYAQGAGHIDKVGQYLRSTLWLSKQTALALDFNIKTNRGVQLSTSIAPIFTILKAHGKTKALLIFTTFDDEFRYPENILVDGTRTYEPLLNAYFRSRQKLHDPLQFEFTPVVIEPPPGVRYRAYPTFNPEAGRKVRPGMIVEWDQWGPGEIQAVYESALKKLGTNDDFDMIIVATDNVGTGQYIGEWNNMDAIVVPLTPRDPYSATELRSGIQALAAFQDIFTIIGHEIVHARGWPGDHFPFYQLSFHPQLNLELDLKTGRRLTNVTQCDQIGNLPDYFSVELPANLRIRVGEEPGPIKRPPTYLADGRISYHGSDPPWFEKVESQSGPCLKNNWIDPFGGLTMQFILKDYNQDGVYELIYDQASPATQTAIYDGLQRTLGWGDVDEDGVGEIEDSTPYGGFLPHTNYTPSNAGVLIEPSSFELTGEKTFHDCRFAQIKLFNGVAGLVPLECPEFNNDIVNIYRGVRYEWLKIEKDYGTVLLPRLPDAGGGVQEDVITDSKRFCYGKKEFRSREAGNVYRPLATAQDVWQNPGDVCALDWTLQSRGLPSSRPLTAKIAELVNIEELSLRNNDLVELPAEIGALSKLKTLDLCGNFLKSLPRELSNLKNLRVLQLCDNEFEHIPQEVFMLPNLEVLDLHQACCSSSASSDGRSIRHAVAKLTSISAEIGRLINLKELNISGHGLKHLPPEIGRLINLETLDLSENYRIELPLEITNLKALKSVMMHSNTTKSGIPAEKIKYQSLFPPNTHVTF